MGKGRLEAFSDGVLAIIITIMVLEIKVPHEATLAALRPLAPVLISYLLSFVFVGIYWNNHHHMLHLTRRITGGVMWANLHLLFWLSLTPFVTLWIGEHPEAAAPTAAYGVVLFMSGVAYYVLEQTIVRTEGPDSPLAKAVGGDFKGKLSAAAYAAAIGLAFVDHWIADAIYVAVAVMWVIPDRRIEKSAVARDADRQG
jgi:uncharacterized membrane protein